MAAQIGFSPSCFLCLILLLLGFIIEDLQIRSGNRQWSFFTGKRKPKRSTSQVLVPSAFLTLCLSFLSCSRSLLFYCCCYLLITTPSVDVHHFLST